LRRPNANSNAAKTAEKPPLAPIAHDSQFVVTLIPALSAEIASHENARNFCLSNVLRQENAIFSGNRLFSIRSQLGGEYTRQNALFLGIFLAAARFRAT
jgi:hypothetical protein